MPGKKQYTNRLIKEKSPYLQQHAHNPVDWYPWGKEAFNAAKDQDKPIFLSIGYATCHWCHVMEHESFENLEIAHMLNETFINIKIDREELPEVDNLYMEFSQSMMSGAAGWPLNVILTPELEPFFATTYLPPHNSHGLMGLYDLILRIQEVWHTEEEKEKILMQAEKIVEVFSETVHAQGDELPDSEAIEDTAELLFKMADPVYGGMKGSPKFPIGYQTNFLLRYSAKTRDSRALFLVERTLDMMSRGGIYDHLGGGFSRYSIDEKWLVPHFEKMLYDNAILAHSYLEAWQITKRPLYRQICEEILDFILREMTHQEGGFYSAQDSDSDGHEGLFYTWTFEEVLEVLGEKEGLLFSEFYDVTPQGNFEGRSILHNKELLEDFADKRGLDSTQLNILFSNQRKQLFDVREKRSHPFKDEKILTSWNGLMIFALAAAGVAFENKRYLEAAIKAAKFIKKNLWNEEKRKLLHRWCEGEALYNGGLDDYAFLIRGLLSLYEADSGSEWLEWSLELTHILEEQFKAEEGAYYQTDGQDEYMILRKCQFADGAEPSGNAIHCENLLRLYQLTTNAQFLDSAEDVLKATKKYIDNYPPGYCYHLINLQRYFDKKAPTILIALNKKEQLKKELANLLFHDFIPHRSIIWRHPDDASFIKSLPFIEKQGPLNNNTTLYICYQGVCQKPLTEITDMIDAIHKL